MSLETQWGQVTTLDTFPFKFEENITKNEHSGLFFLIYAQAVFQKGHLETPKVHMKPKLYYGSYEAQNTATTAYYTFYPEKSVCTTPYLSLSPTSLSQTPSPCSYPQTQQVEKIIENKYNNHNTILYGNIFIEVHWLHFLSNNQPPSTTKITFHNFTCYLLLKSRLHIYKHTEL